MDAKLILHHSEMSDEDIQKLTIELKNSVNRETDLTAQLPEEAGGLGTKGDVVTIGQIILAAVGSGGALAALLPVLRLYFERKPTLRMEIELGDGRRAIIESEHLQPAQIQQATEAVRQLFEQTGDKDNGENG
ncbi:MAG: hypothetical protein Q3M24_13535 [Candidatus Electrothrix aestuarii]|uniref:Uncharacterized protein n=1 Tax=Candidatus Electrothrix aestuarii TaxID=3062594 RepID=A0AAU8LQZ8_9BACT|nr:hypothetical protein [Candidatus Electrothrix aestuarii]